MRSLTPNTPPGFRTQPDEHIAFHAPVIRESSLARFAVDSGLADAATLDDIARAWERWGDDPGVFHAQANGEAVGWKRSTSD
jgi:hypothetical protein